LVMTENEKLQYVRDFYKVPAYVGRVVYAGGKRGVVTGASGPHVKVCLDGARRAGIYHPADQIVWTEESAPLPKRTKGQRLYDAWLNSECNESFIEFLQNPYWKEYRKRA